jgi:AcrR family transcriptional regulator
MAAKPRTTPRKLPQQERSRATMDAILTATARILVKDGFDRASTNRIADEAGVSVGSLYQYFPGKEALVAALIEKHIDEMMLLFARAFESMAFLPLAQATRELVSLHLRAHSLDPKLHQVLSEQVPNIDRSDRVRDVERTVMLLVKTYLAAHRDEICVEDLDLAAFVVVQAVEGVTHAALLHDDHLNQEKLIDEISALVIRYLSGGSPTVSAAAGRAAAPKPAPPPRRAIRR